MLLLFAKGPPHTSGFKRLSNRSCSAVQLALFCCFKWVFVSRTVTLVVRTPGRAARSGVPCCSCRWQFAGSVLEAAVPAAGAATTADAINVLCGSGSTLRGASRDQWQTAVPLLACA